MTEAGKATGLLKLAGLLKPEMDSEKMELPEYPPLETKQALTLERQAAETDSEKTELHPQQSQATEEMADLAYQANMAVDSEMTATSQME